MMRVAVFAGGVHFSGTVLPVTCTMHVGGITLGSMCDACSVEQVVNVGYCKVACMPLCLCPAPKLWLLASTASVSLALDQ
jgi:hypothetical protein